MAKAISKQRWKEVHNSRSNCEPMFLDMACRFWGSKWKQ